MRRSRTSSPLATSVRDLAVPMTTYSLVLDIAVSADLNLALQSDRVRIAAGGDDDVGINTYLIKCVCDKVGVDGRSKVFHRGL